MDSHGMHNLPAADGDLVIVVLNERAWNGRVFTCGTGADYSGAMLADAA